jgi:SSS family solute:Na+ symporter
MLLISVVLYFVLTLSIGFYASGRVKSAGDFINAGRNLHPAVNTAALFALWFGSETVFGASAEFAQHGLMGIIEDPMGGVLCLLLTGFFFSRKLYRLNVLTIGDLFRRNFGARVEMTASFLMIVSFIGYAGAQIVALGLLTQTLLDVDLQTGMYISTSIVVLYTFTGGMWAVSVTDFLQSILIVAGLVAAAFFITAKLGSIDIVFNSIPEEKLQFLPNSTALDWTNWLASWMVLGLGSIASQDIFQRINSARSERAAFSSTLLGGALYLLFSMLPLYLVTAIHLINPELMKGDLQLALPQLVLSTMPVWLQVLFFGSLMSAIMSTCSGALLAPASILSENIIRPNLGKQLSDKDFLFLTRISVVVISLAALLLANGKQNIFELVGEASVIGLVTIFVPFVAALFWNYTNARGAMASMMAGTLVYIFFRFVYTTELNPLIPGLTAAIAGLLAGFTLKSQIAENKV